MGRRVVDLTGAAWVKSKRSTAQGNNCVEVARTAACVAVRDSKHPQGPVLVFAPGEWHAFTTAAKAGSGRGRRPLLNR
jgi:hypothetical protein